MADKITVTNELKIMANFVDGDTRTLTVDSPKADLTAEQLKSVSNTFKEAKAIIGDKTGAEFTGFVYAKEQKKEVTVLDLS